MTIQTSNAALYERTVGNIAATLPGATAVFRSEGSADVELPAGTHRLSARSTLASAAPADVVTR